MLPPSISVPAMAALRHCTSVGIWWPRHNAHTSSSPPATTKRVPIWKNGGKLSSANLMPRYVDPQMNQVAARHAMISGEKVFVRAVTCWRTGWRVERSPPQGYHCLWIGRRASQHNRRHSSNDDTDCQPLVARDGFLSQRHTKQHSDHRVDKAVTRSECRARVGQEHHVGGERDQ